MEPTPKTKKKEVEVAAWKTSDAKNKLKWDIINGVVTDSMGPRELYDTRPELQVYKYVRFSSNLRALRISVAHHIDRATIDSANLYQDTELHPRPALTNGGYRILQRLGYC